MHAIVFIRFFAIHTPIIFIHEYMVSVVPLKTLQFCVFERHRLYQSVAGACVHQTRMHFIKRKVERKKN